MNSLYSSSEISKIFIQAVDQHYVNIKEYCLVASLQKEKANEEELSDKHFITNNFDFLNDSTDIDSSTLDDDGSRKNSSDFSVCLSQKQSLSNKNDLVKVSSKLISNYDIKIKHQKDKNFSNLKEFLSTSNYIQVNGYNGFYHQNCSNSAQNNDLKSSNNFTMTVGCSNTARLRCNSFPTNIIFEKVSSPIGNLKSSFQKTNITTTSINCKGM